MKGLFIAGTGTNVGKTLLTRGLARACARAGEKVAALKPLETGCDPAPVDAIALAHACGHAALANADGFYRAMRPLAPFAATLAGEQAPPSIDSLVAATGRASESFHVKLVEGAGGLFSPIDERNSMLELALALGLRIALVARDELGALSQVRAAVLASEARGAKIHAVILSYFGEPFTFNAQILRMQLGDGIAVHSFSINAPSDDALADEVDRHSLRQALLGA